MRVIPPYNILVAPDLFHLVHELLLENGIDRLNGDCRSHLRHGKDINDSDGVIVNDFADHETHDFERHASPAVLHHFEQGKG